MTTETIEAPLADVATPRRARQMPDRLALFLAANAAFGVLVALTGAVPHVALHAGSPAWVIALGLPVAAVLVWAMSTVRRSATTGQRGRLYPLALALAVVTLLATCLLVVLLVAMALQGGNH